MKNKFLTLSLVLVSIYAKAQQIKQPIDNFNAIELSGVQEIHLMQGTENSITIDGVSDINGSIKPIVSGNTLKLDYDKKKPLPKNAKIIITFKSIELLEVSGAQDVESDNEFALTELKIKSSGSSDVKIKCNATKIVTDISGAGDIQIKGSAKELQVNISGAGALDANELLANKVSVNVSGAGDAKVNAIEELTGNCTGSGSVKFKGNPTNVRVTQTGVGSITPFDADENAMEFNLGNGKGDTTKIQIGKKKIMIIGDENEESKEKIESNEYPNRDKIIEKKIVIKKDEKEVKNIWQGIEIGVNGYATSAGKTAMPAKYGYLDLNYGKSIMINFNLIEKHVKLYKENIALTTGLGLQFNRYSFSRSTQLQSNTDSLYAVDTKIDYKKNLLRMTYLTLPILLEFNTNSNPNKSFHIAFGPLLAYRLGRPKLVQKFETLNGDANLTLKNSFNVNDFQYGLTARIGYGKVNLFATYDFSNQFKNNKTLAVQPFHVGFTLIPF